MKLSIIDEIVDDIWEEARAGVIAEGIAEGKELGIAEGKELGIAEGKELGIEKNKLQVAKDMIKEGYSKEEILKISRITDKQLLSLLKI